MLWASIACFGPKTTFGRDEVDILLVLELYLGDSQGEAFPRGGQGMPKERLSCQLLGAGGLGIGVIGAK